MKLMSAELIALSLVGTYLAGVLVSTSIIKYHDGDEPFKSVEITEYDHLGYSVRKVVKGPAHGRIWGWPWELLKGLAILPWNMIEFTQRITPSKIERQRKALMKSVPKDFPLHDKRWDAKDHNHYE